MSEICNTAALPHVKLDGRTRAAKVLRDTKAALLSGLGRAPTAAENFVIKRISMFELKLRMLDSKAAPTAADTAAYTSLARTQADLLEQLRLPRPDVSTSV